jgi:glutamate synthase (NADPH/NADH) small chain
LRTVRVEWTKDEQGRMGPREIPGTEKIWPAQLVLLAMGFLGPEKKGAIEQLGLALDGRGNVQCDEEYMTSERGVFAAGDMRRGQSLVVWAIHEGREAARAVDKFLMGLTHLPSASAGDFAWR